MEVLLASGGAGPRKSRFRPFAFRTDAWRTRPTRLGNQTCLRPSCAKRSLPPARFRPGAYRAAPTSANRTTTHVASGLVRCPGVLRPMPRGAALPRPYGVTRQEALVLPGSCPPVLLVFLARYFLVFLPRYFSVLLPRYFLAVFARYFSVFLHRTSPPLTCALVLCRRAAAPAVGRHAAVRAPESSHRRRSAGPGGRRAAPAGATVRRPRDC